MSARIACRTDGPSDGEKWWKATWTVAAGHEKASYQSANILFEPVDADPNPQLTEQEALHIVDGGSGSGTEIHIGRRSFDFLHHLLRHATSVQAIKLIGPRGDGNVVRSNIIPKRMHDVEHVEASVALAEPLQLYTDQAWSTSTPLSTLFRTSAGALHLSTQAAAPSPEFWLALEGEMEKRLGLPLVLPGLKRQLMFLVEGGLHLPFDGACSWQLYDAAKSLGIDVVVLASPGHVLQQRAQFIPWYHHFVAVQCGFDADFPTRIVTAVREYEREHARTADGIVTGYESYHVAVSMAAKQLGLPCEPVSAFEVATDKFKTSLLEGRKSYTASSVDEALQVARTEEIPWPLILKPCRGWASDLVFKVDNIQQLEQAAPRMKSDSHGNNFVMEHYCSGPEVDINFVLYDGKVLFWEIGDETPKNADNGSTSFGELDYLFPSQLPDVEQMIVHDAVLQSMTRLGFRNGIYHCEARIENSAVEWRFDSSGIPALEPRQDHSGKPAESWLIEINTRPPGGDTCDFIDATWGVDYWALLFVTKLRNASAWAHALSQPYRDGAQYHADKVWIIANFDASKKGIYESGNITEELVQRRPDIAKHLSQHRTFSKKGDQLRHQSTGSNSFVAYLHVFSRQSRAHLLELVDDIRKELTIEIS